MRSPIPVVPIVTWGGLSGTNVAPMNENSYGGKAPPRLVLELVERVSRNIPVANRKNPVAIVKIMNPEGAFNLQGSYFLVITAIGFLWPNKETASDESIVIISGPSDDPDFDVAGFEAVPLMRTICRMAWCLEPPQRQ